MTHDDLFKMLSNGGGIFIVGEYRGSSISNGSKRDIKTGAQRDWYNARHTIEVRNGNEVRKLFISQSADRAEACKPLPYPPGTKIVARPVKIDEQSGIQTVSVRTNPEPIK